MPRHSQKHKLKVPFKSSERKGRVFFCKSCGTKTRHIPGGVDDKQVGVVYGKTVVSKIVWFTCTVCGECRSINRW